MKTICLAICVLFSCFAYSQEKGVAPIHQKESNNSHQQTYAVVVGISDYQDEGIPDLRFADKDAEAFANFLRSPAGGSLDEDHLKILTNKEATAGKVAANLYWLMDECREGDKAIIYFSGHGDVEDRFKRQPGFLLCWDAPEKVYLAGGVIDLRLLQDVISVLSLDTKAKVVVVTDACRAGKLSGSTLGGVQTTTANLQKQYANEIKILSCQPDEFSIEGEQWGGGRGAFSYHLLDGLYGMADRNTDQSVNLMEIRGYLEENVSSEVAPQNQLPMVVGNGREKLTDVFPEILDQLKEDRQGQMQQFTATESRGVEEDVLAVVDSNVVEMYRAFQQAVEDRQFLQPEHACADFYYKKLSEEPQLERLHASMRRNYAAALQDDAQQVMNRLLKSDPGENTKTLLSINKEYGQYPANLRRAANLLGEAHYMYRILLARSYWFEGYIKDESSCACKNVANANKVLPYYRKALEYQPNMPHAWAQMSAVYGIQKQDIDSAEYYVRLAIDAVPAWLLVYSWMGNIYLNYYWDTKQTELLEKASWWLEQGAQIDSNSIIILNQLSYLFNLQDKFKEEQAILDRSLQVDSLAHTMHFKGEGYTNWGKYKKAEAAFRWAIQKDSSWLYDNMNGITKVYALTGQSDKLHEVCNKMLASNLKIATPYSNVGNAIFPNFPEIGLMMYSRAYELDSTNAHYCNFIALSHTYMKDGDYNEALMWHKKAVELEPENQQFINNEGLIYLRWNQFEAAERLFKKAAAMDFLNGHAALFMLYLQNDMTAEAEEQLKYCMETNPNGLPNFLRWVGHRNLQFPEQVPLYFKKMEELYPDNPFVNFQYAVHLCMYEKDKEAAFEALEKALKKGLEKSMLRENHLTLLKMDRQRWNQLIKPYFPTLIID